MVKRTTRSFTIAICTVILLMLSSFSYAGPNNLMPDPSFESMTVGTTVTTPNCTNIGYLRFVNNYGGTSSTGKLEVVSPGEDGNAAVKVSKTSASEGVQVDLDVQAPVSWMPVQGGHTYRVSFWARTDDPGSALVLAEAGFQGWTHLGSQYPGWALTSDWTMYTTQWTAPANADLFDLAFVLNTPGSFIIDNVSVEDVAPAANMMPDQSFESLNLQTVTATGTTGLGDGYMRFVNISGQDTLQVISNAQDGNRAIKVTRKTADYSTQVDLDGNPTASWIPVQAGHKYRMTFWARTDDATWVQLQVNWRNGWYPVSAEYHGWELTPRWTQYTCTYFAPSNANLLQLTWLVGAPGSAVIDNVHVEDVVPDISSITGTVTNMLSGAVIAGANVSVTSGGTTTSTTTDANGVYTLNNLATGTYDMTVTAAGYSTANVPGVLAYWTSTRDVSMTPSASTSWTVTDTFTRDPNTDLGHTEDANAIPWVKTSDNTNSSISSNALMLNMGSVPGGACLGRSFTPDNFDMSVNMTWDQNLMYSAWAGIAYRQDKVGVYNQGYFLYCPYADGDGNATIQLQYNGTKIASAPIKTDYMWGGENGVTLRVYVNGTRHKVWVNDIKVIDTVDSQKTSGGYVGLFCDPQNRVAWDNFNMSSSAPVALKTPVIRYFDATAAATGLSNAQTYDVYHTTSCIQGLANRQAPRLFVRYPECTNTSPDDSLWLGRLLEQGGLCEDWPVVDVNSIGDLVDIYRGYINGVIVYDDTTGVLSTSLAATTAAACEGAIAVRKDTASDSLYTYLTVTKGLPVLIDLSGKFTGSGTIWGTNGVHSTGSAKCDAYIWAKVNYLDTGKCNPTVLSYTLDEYGLKIGQILWVSQLSNLDYAVSQKAFCFDLSPWGDERPNDDLVQPLGTDRNTFMTILNACNIQTGQSKMIRFCGFPRWDVKYTNYQSIGGSHSPSSTESYFIQLLGPYNAYCEPYAPSPSWVANTSFYAALKPEVMDRRYVQNPPPTYTDMVTRGLIDSNGNVLAGNYIMIGLGDYDGPIWPLYQLGSVRGINDQYLGQPIWDNTERGNVYCNWGINPNLIDRASVALDYFYRHKSSKDFFIGWDSGAGYVDPARLHGTRISGYGDARPMWQEHCKNYYRMLDYSITGWTYPPIGSSELEVFIPFSNDGVGSAGGQRLLSNMPCSQKGTDFANNYSTGVINNSTGANFASYDTCMWTPSMVRDLKNYWGTTNNHQFLDAPTYFYLLRYYLGGSNNYRATWVGDTIPRIMAKGHTYSATVTVRNDGWDTWSQASLYGLGYAIVSSGTTPAGSDYDAHSRFQVPSGATVAPGQSVTFTVNIVAPSTNGKYDLYYDMVKEGVTWFRTLNNLEWKKQVFVATNETDVDTDGDGVPDVTEDANGTLYWNSDDNTPIIPVSVSTIADAKGEADGTRVAITNGMVVTAAFNGSFYIEQTGRQSGIKVVSYDTVVIGSKVTVTGTLGTSNGERQIIATSTPVVVGSGTVLPLGMTNKAIGGLDITSGSGVGNVGLLVKVWGHVVDRSNPSYILIDDGSGLNIKVDRSNVGKSLDSGTTFVTVTGICSAEETSGVVTPVIIPRSNTDVSW
ncbi:carboxypeptidase regulatory-like domain-containing protein [bacterium]|nr:carboxypeptidase regulatory-like domain-containing protein [bacterium]